MTRLGAVLISQDLLVIEQKQLFFWLKITLSLFVCVRAGTHVAWYIHDGQKTALWSLLSPSTTWVPGSEIRVQTP